MGNKKNRHCHRNTHRHIFKSCVNYYKHKVTPQKKTDKSTTQSTSTENSETPVPMQCGTEPNDNVVIDDNVVIEGSRIINMTKLQHYIADITTHAAKCGSEMKLNGEMRDGLASIFGCSCMKCGHNIKLETSEKVKGPRGYKRWECNLAAVWGQMSSGGGHTPLQETMSVLGVPVMAKKNFTSTERDIGEWWRSQFEKSCLEAGREEKRLAEERCDYHEGVPAITVIVDGGWSKRSHKHSYNAKSGVAIIAGQATGKILFLGVRNKYCTACTQGIPVENHNCYKNWDSSSSEMETDIILEGFQKAEQMHGVRYTSFVGDGDSSVYPSLLNGVTGWGRDIKKMECANHSCKCYRSSLEKLVTDNPKYKGKGGLTVKMRKRLTSAARCAIKMRSRESDRAKAVKLLEGDLINGPFHCFGQHSNCSPDFCKTAQSQSKLSPSPSNLETPSGSNVDEDGSILSEIHDAVEYQQSLWEDTIGPAEEIACPDGEQPINLDPKMMHEIQVSLSRLVAKAPQLIGNFTTNLAEAWMHVRSKFDGGKVINRSQAGSWEFRCLGAGLQHNLGKTWGPKLWSELTMSAPNPIFSSVMESFSKKADKEKKRKESPAVKEKRRQSKYSQADNTAAARQAYTRHDEGISPEEVTDDISPEYLAELKNSYYTTKVMVTKEEADDIEKNTRGQSDSDQWLKERNIRITASVAGGIAKMRKNTKRCKKIEAMLYHRFRGNEATRYGNRMEKFARDKYILYHKQKGNLGLKVYKVGLVISSEHPWLAASPDNRVHDPKATPTLGLAEYKNPFAVRQMTISEACDAKSTLCLKKIQKESLVTYKLKENHDYYFQMQCQMYCDDKEWCDFVVSTEEDMHIERVYRNRKWWGDQLTMLKSFYFDSLLPELACPRYRKGGIREPQLTT